MSKNYYCLVAGLPDLKVDSACGQGTNKKLPLSLIDFREQWEDLSDRDLRLAEMFLLPYDHENIVNKLYKIEGNFDSRGKYTEEQLGEILDRTIEPEERYLKELIENFGDTNYNKIECLSRLQSGWVKMIEECGNDFCKEYTNFNNTLKNIFVALQGRKYNMDVVGSIIGEGEVVDQIRKNRSADFGLKGEIDYIDQAVQLFGTTDILEREMKIDALRWNWIDEQTFFDYFTIEKIIATTLKLSMLERWSSMSEEDGREKFALIVQDIKDKYKV